MPSIESILKENGLRKTDFRRELLSLFFTVQSSLTAEEIYSKLEKTRDKATIYRGLDTFETNGLIHRVPDRKNLTRYALCNKEDVINSSIQQHAHFICDSCHETFCLHEVEVPQKIDLEGYQIESFQLTFKGECFDCRGTHDL